MYLTRFPINVTRRATRKMVTSPYCMHAAIAGCFPPSTGTDVTGRILWRIDNMDDGGFVLYIASPTKPSLMGLDEQIGWPDLDQQWETRDYEPFVRSIHNGGLYHFRLAANPVVNRVGIVNDHGATKRLPHLTTLHQAAWLVGATAYEETGAPVPLYVTKQGATRAERNGFEVCHDDSGSLQLVVSNVRKRTFEQGKGGRTITLLMVQYDGILEVTNADKLRHVLRYGLGKAKGFGCGLMTLVPMGA
ncbi:MAG: type I-E CRISPR-associated protein Cas6/Cse3/CasE [Atopobiaceae bacterium]|nr:type I-E CRISPR-associated protein Cas6/Cse3/CasE [Atopobiaceae bacterium]